jgi:hypothetical protein
MKLIVPFRNFANGPKILFLITKIYTQRSGNVDAKNREVCLRQCVIQYIVRNEISVLKKTKDVYIDVNKVLDFTLLHPHTSLTKKT